MLHSKIYNQGISREMKDAFSRRDLTFFHSRIFRLSADLINGNGEQDYVYSQLHICLALLDSMKNGGETVSLMTDFINL